MHYKNIIGVNENFQYSVNLQFDINNIDKVKEYIPTRDACEVLRFYFNSVLNGRNRSTTLIGPYGKGKSHLLLILITLLNNYNEADKKVIETFINKIKKIDLELYEMLLEVRKENKKLMPIIINSNYDDLHQAFLLALSEALDRENLNDLVVNTYFDVALKVIEKWEDNYQTAIENLTGCLNEYDCDLKTLKSQLKNYSQKGYELFKTVYSCVLHGQEFSPLVNTDIVKTFKDISYKIKDYGYDGIFIVFDEFSKFLEYADNDRIMKDLKLLQDFAELAARTGKEDQIHLSCITHKTINEYIKNFKEEKTNAFKTVEGRFKEIYFNRSIEQNYEIVSYALEKKDGFKAFFKEYSDNYKSFYDELKELPIFSELANVESNLFEGCFPLNPLTVFSLIQLSEKIAQNERTLFTFITDDDSNSLKSFINNGLTTELFGMDKVYDYFYPLLKKENDELIKSIWLKAESSIKKSATSEETKIIKATAIVYMINDLDTLFPDDQTIRLSIGLDEDDYDTGVLSLINKSLLKRKKITEELDFANIYNREITREIKNVVEAKFANVNYKETLNKIIDLGYVLPRRYNEQYKITRFFKNIFITEEELLRLANFEFLLKEYKSDGLILNLLRTSKNVIELKEKMELILDDVVVLRVPKKQINNNFISLLKEYEAINYLKHTDDSTEEIVNELELMEIELLEVINEAVEEYFAEENIQEYIHKGVVNRKIKTVSSYVSDICNNIYSATPIVNNEMINKREITAPIKKARNIVIDTILNEDATMITSQTSAEATIYKAIFLKKDNETISAIINIIKRFIKDADNNKKSFSFLYSVLEAKPYSIRKGILPVLISIALHEYSDNLILYYQNREIDLNSDSLVKINDNPEKYYLITEKGTADKIEYLNDLLKIFNIESINNPRVDLKRLVETMKKWILSLPRLLREFNDPSLNAEFSESYIQVKNELLKPDINNNEFVYKQLLKIVSADNYQEVVNEIAKMKKMFDYFIYDYSTSLIENTKDIIDSSYKGSLSTLLKDWYKRLNKNVAKTVYDVKTRNFLDYIKEYNTHDETDILENLARIITNYYIEDWLPEYYNQYLIELEEIKNNILNSEITEITDKRIILVNGDEKIEKYLNSDLEITPIAKTMKNNIEELMSEYGESLNEQEKINVLLDIMQKYM
ncbi:MAG: hypothetical protein PHR25_02170 [Clostridia bacterium]|nr:hypothetical protein [Clostridia bacterium]